jgi:hypothetical protein
MHVCALVGDVPGARTKTVPAAAYDVTAKEVVRSSAAKRWTRLASSSQR